MIYIDKTPNLSGAYPNPKNQPFPNCIALNDEQESVFFQYNGFVSVAETADGVTVNPNIEAWETWKASQPEEAPEKNPEETEENSVWDELDAAYQEGVDSV